MEQPKQEVLTYPYPSRSSELVRVEGIFAEVEPIVLGSQERQKLLAFDQELFKKLEPLRKLAPETHTVYPDFFLTDQGWRLFQLAYLDPNLKERAEASTKEKEISLENEKDKKRFFNEVFDRLMKATASEEDFERYRKGNKIEIEEVKKPLTREEVMALFFDLENLSEIPTQIRRRINRVSYEYARGQFLEEFQVQDGEVEKVADPYRVSRIVDVEKLIDKVSGYRELKREMKGLRKEEGSFSEAKSTLARIYVRYLNVLIAGGYDYGRILGAQSSLTGKEKRALEKIRGVKLDEGKQDRFSLQKASRTMERIDHFLKGVGLEIGEGGLFKTIPANLRRFIEARAGMAAIGETPDYQRYNSIKVDANQAKRLAELVYQAYGFDSRGWSIYLSPTHKGLSVSYRKKGEKIKEVNIPKSLKSGLIGFLAVLAHEIEGHVLRFDNREQGIGQLALLREFSMGRTEIFSEAGAMWIEDQTKRRLVDMPRLAKPYYGLMLLEKQRGGSFKDCFRTYLDAYIKINRQDPDRVFKRAFSSALRIFRRQTPLNDKSGFLPASSQLDYIEQELVVQTLFENGWGKILFLGGIDLYSIYDLQRLGFLDWEKIQEPKFVIAKEIWPVIKSALDRGKSLQEAIDVLEQFPH